ncbi:MAG: hypothetical protein CBC48_05655 [bacterium TMED88]|nr:MAG: hypothetical protein CBC48_05655 [bacterium TMED88]
MLAPSILGCDHLTRVILASLGGDAGLTRKIAGVRNALDRRIEAAVFGENKAINEPQRTALRAVRTGRFDIVRFFNIIGKEDKGTMADPLKTLAGKSADEAHILIVEAFQRLTFVISVAMPTLSTAATPFFFKFQKILVDYINDGAPIPVLSKWAASVLGKVALPRRQYAFNEMGGSSSPRFDITLLENMTDERIELERATQERRALKAARSVAGGKGNGKSDKPPGYKPPGTKPGKPGQREQRAPDPNSKRSKKRAREAAALAAAAGGGDDDDDDDLADGLAVVDDDAEPRRAPGVKAGKRVPVPAKSLSKADKTKAWGPFMEKHPKVNGVSACWDYWHPQGCTRENCTFHHD